MRSPSALNQTHNETIVYVLALLVVAIPRLTQAEIRPDIDQDIPLATAIKQANLNFPDAQPLTEDKVISAVRAIKLQDPGISDAMYKVYQRVVKERGTAPGHVFQSY